MTPQNFIDLISCFVLSAFLCVVIGIVLLPLAEKCALGCGAGTQISGSSSRHLNLLAPAPERFRPLTTKNHCNIGKTRFPTNYVCRTGSEISVSGSTVQNCLASAPRTLFTPCRRLPQRSVALLESLIHLRAELVRILPRTTLSRHRLFTRRRYSPVLIPGTRRPPATLVKQKKKRKRGYDSSDEMNANDTLQGTPPPSPDDSLVEVR